MDVEQAAQRQRNFVRQSPVAQAPKRRGRVSRNALIAVGLWALLWSGYNTGPWYVEDPRFPASTAELFHGIRAFFPLFAGWFAILLLIVRAKRVGRGIMGPLGLVLFFSMATQFDQASLATDATGKDVVMQIASGICRGEDEEVLSLLKDYPDLLVVMHTASVVT